MVSSLIPSHTMFPMDAADVDAGAVNVAVCSFQPTSLMPAFSFLPRPHLTCTAGVKTLLSLLSFSLTVRIASLNVKVPTSTLFSHTSTTLAHPILVSTFTPSHFALRSTSLLALATSHASTTPLFSLFKS